jgi:hypothetical protein
MMEAQMIFHKTLDEVIPVVIPRMPAQVSGCEALAGRFETFRLQLLGQEFVGQPLVDQDALRNGA